jgi:DNA-binding HxlR family transcriptional regulator
MMERHSVVGVLEAIADSKSLEIFRDIAKGTVESEILKKKEGISKKQFYRRTRQMLNTGIIKRVKGKFSLTNFGVVIYHAQLVMEKGVNSFWTGQLGENERMKLIKRILDDDAIENILVKQR